MNGPLSVVQIGPDRVAAIQVVLRKGRVTVVAACGAVRPEGVSNDNPQELGTWVRQTLDAAGINARRTILAAARSEVVLKVLEFPGGGIADEAERCEVVRLQMARQLTMPITESVIDWLPMSGGGEESASSVLAGAIHVDRLGWYQQVAEAAGLKPVGIQLSSGGITALTSASEGTVLTVAPSLSGIEYVVASDHRVLFARSIDFPDVSEQISDAAAARERADRIAVEAKRTWMSYRVSQRAEDVHAVAVIGFGAECERVRIAASELMELPGICVELPEAVRVRNTKAVDRNAAVYPLIGLALRAAAGEPGMDFLNPRKPPDTAARRRMVALAAVFALIVLAGAGYLVRDQKLRSLGRVETELKEEKSRLQGKYLEFLGDLARTEHLERWDAMDADYLGHIGWLSEHLPDPKNAQADRMALAMAGEVRYTGTAFPGGVWSDPARLMIAVSGRVRGREVTLSLRDRLLKTGPYVVANRGPDVADRYDFELSTTQLGAPAEEAPPATDTAPPEPETTQPGEGS